MLVRGMVNECDYTNRKYDPPVEGGWVISQGATGRWCTVITIGPEVIEEQSCQLISYEEALSEIKTLGGYADF